MLFLLALIFGLQRFSAKTRENYTTEKETATFDIYFIRIFKQPQVYFKLKKLAYLKPLS